MAVKTETEGASIRPNGIEQPAMVKPGEGTFYKMHHAPTLEGGAHGAKHSEIPSLPVLMPFDLDER